jgi:RNA polymerase sigma factor (sigma-70 family)
VRVDAFGRVPGESGNSRAVGCDPVVEAEMTGAEGQSIAELFTAHAERLKRRARRILGSDADAEDAVQEVMLTILNAPHALSAVDRLVGWLFTLVRRRCADIIRSDAARRAREVGATIDELFAGSGDPAALMETEEAAGLVAEVVEELPATLKYAFVANALEGLTYRQMSEDSGVPMGTLMSRKQNAVEAIRARLRGKGLIA